MVPTRPFALGGETNLQRRVLFEQVQGQLTQNSEILGGMVLTSAAFIFTKDHIEYPVEAVLNLPVSTHAAQQPVGIGW